MSWTSRWSGSLGFSISALIHLGVGIAVIWQLEGDLPEGDTDYRVPVDLAMFAFAADSGPTSDPPGESTTAEAILSVTEPEPAPEAQQDAEPESQLEPEPEPGAGARARAGARAGAGAGAGAGAKTRTAVRAGGGAGN